MAIKSIKISNVLSFDNLEITDIEDMNCIVGRNNVGKSNLLKALKFFYNKLEEKDVIPPRLYSNYTRKGTISVTFDTTRIFWIARKNTGNSYFSFIMRKLIPLHKRGIFALQKFSKEKTTFTLTLNIYNDSSINWSTKDRQTRNLILYLYPFFYIEPRHMDLHDWDSLWDLVARLKSFNLSKINNDNVIDFFDKNINADTENSYKKYITDLNITMSTRKSTQNEKVLSYIKAGLDGYKFEVNESELKFQSDGTNSFHFIRTFLKILITISKREYITPFVLIDEPELGLHPKMNEVLVNDIFSYYKYQDDTNSKTLQPRIFINTHSPNIVKEIIKKFREKQSVLCFQKTNSTASKIFKLNSKFDNESFINIFSDNEARLFFSSYILFVEGETEQEVFGNMKLAKHFPQLMSIDIYKSSSNVIGERINPSYSNSAIPYLFLFDADKAWGLAKSNSRTKSRHQLNAEKNGNYFSLKKQDLMLERKKYSFGYSKKYQNRKNNIDFMLNSINEDVNIFYTKQSFTNEKVFRKTHDAINKHLLINNFYINRTTFEGCLINSTSASIFYDWLLYKYNIDMKPIIAKVKSSQVFSELMLIEFMRVIFNGKTSILTDYKSFNLTAYDNAIRDGKNPSEKLLRTSRRAKLLMKFLEEGTIKNKQLGKTDGWATSFLDFAVDKIEQESLKENSAFGTTFDMYFPELYGIIRMLQPDS